MSVLRVTVDMTLSGVLDQLGYTHKARSRDLPGRHVYRDGERVLSAVSADDVWCWLADTGQICRGYDREALVRRAS